MPAALSGDGFGPSNVGMGVRGCARVIYGRSRLTIRGE